MPPSILASGICPECGSGILNGKHVAKSQCSIGRMTAALRQIGYSAHSGTPRMGPKAQTARWGLGEDTHPDEPKVP